MKAIKYLPIIVCSLLINGCATSTLVKSKTTRVLEVAHKPIIADLEVTDKKITGTVKGKAGDNLENLKKTAISEALSSAGADVLVQPDFETQTDGYETTVTVTGRPAVYKNFRPMTEADIPLINAGKSEQVTKLSSNVASQETKHSKSRGAGGIALAAIAVSVVLIIFSLAQ